LEPEPIHIVYSDDDDDAKLQCLSGVRISASETPATPVVQSEATWSFYITHEAQRNLN
jgi:hypothetical protein